jgi:hypothetical protein
MGGSPSPRIFSVSTVSYAQAASHRQRIAVAATRFLSEPLAQMGHAGKRVTRYFDPGNYDASRNASEIPPDALRPAKLQVIGRFRVAIPSLFGSDAEGSAWFVHE